METIGRQRIWSFTQAGERSETVTCTQIRQSAAVSVSSYMDLAERIAELQFMNRDFVLLFRGQSADWANKAGNSSLKPTIMRASQPKKVLTEAQLKSRFDALTWAEETLLNSYCSRGIPGSTRLRRQQILTGECGVLGYLLAAADLRS